jgi:hypothetical protein
MSQDEREVRKAADRAIAQAKLEGEADQAKRDAQVEAKAVESRRKLSAEQTVHREVPLDKGSKRGTKLKTPTRRRGRA